MNIEYSFRSMFPSLFIFCMIELGACNSTFAGLCSGLTVLSSQQHWRNGVISGTYGDSVL